MQVTIATLPRKALLAPACLRNALPSNNPLRTRTFSAVPVSDALDRRYGIPIAKCSKYSGEYQRGSITRKVTQGIPTTTTAIVNHGLDRSVPIYTSHLNSYGRRVALSTHHGGISVAELPVSSFSRNSRHSVSSQSKRTLIVASITYYHVGKHRNSTVQDHFHPRAPPQRCSSTRLAEAMSLFHDIYPESLGTPP